MQALDIERGIGSRRGSNAPGLVRRLYDQARALVHQPLSHDQARAVPNQPSEDGEAVDSVLAQSDRLASMAFRAAAVAEAAPAVAPAGRMQPWENNNLVARIPVAAQHSKVQPWATSSLPQTTAMPVDSPLTESSDAQLDTFSGSCKKRSAPDASQAEPAAKRWQIEAFPGAAAGTGAKSINVWDIANAARLSRGGRHNVEGGVEDYEMAEGLMGLQAQQNGVKLKVVLSRAATAQKPEVMDES